MKIISEDINGNFYCYVQVRDINYLVKEKDYTRFYYLYNRCLEKGLKDTDFVRIDDHFSIEAIINLDEIIDFRDYCSENQLYLTRVIINGVYDKSAASKLKSDAIRDIISFQNKSLNYKIPIVPTRQFGCLNENIGVVFTTTNLPGYYLVSSTNDIPLNEKNYHNFIKEQIKDTCKLENLKEDEVLVDMFPVEKSIVVRISKKVIKKESIFQKVFKKKK